MGKKGVLLFKIFQKKLLVCKTYFRQIKKIMSIEKL
jgi:hypothetical protein